MHRIDDEDFPEIAGQLDIFAQPVDDVADRDMLRHRNELALHQAVGGFLGKGEGVLDRGAIFGLHRLEDGLLLVLLHVLDDRDRVVGIHLRREFGDLFGREQVDQLLAHIIVHLRQHIGRQKVAEHGGEHRAFVGAGEFEQVGDVGGVEAPDAFARGFGFTRFGKVDDIADEFGFQPVVLVEFGFAVGVDQHVVGRQGIFAFVHRAVLPMLRRRNWPEAGRAFP